MVLRDWIIKTLRTEKTAKARGGGERIASHTRAPRVHALKTRTVFSLPYGRAEVRHSLKPPQKGKPSGAIAHSRSRDNKRTSSAVAWLC